MSQRNKTLKNELRVPNEKWVNTSRYIGDDYSVKALDDDIKTRISILEAKFENIYEMLRGTAILKATPLKALIFQDRDKCHDNVVNIYNNWIAFFSHMSYINRISNGLTFNNIFENIDRFIFRNYFSDYRNNNNINYIVKFLTKSSGDHSEMDKFILSTNRHLNTLNLQCPENKEYISIAYYDNIIYLYYFPDELTQISITRNHKTEKCNDIQIINKHPDICNNSNVINQIDNKGVPIGLSPDGSTLVNLDRRFVVLSAERPLFNTAPNIYSLDGLNKVLYGVSQQIVDFTIIIFHAMLHIKCFLETKNSFCMDHNEDFINQFINFTPSALFGHSLFPPVTLS